MTKFIRYQSGNGTTVYVNPSHIVRFQFVSGGMSKLFLAAGSEEFIFISDKESFSVAEQLQKLGALE